MARTLAIAGTVAIGLLGCNPQAGNEIASGTTKTLGPRQAFDQRDNDPRCVDGVDGLDRTWASVANDERTATTIAERYFAANFPEINPTEVCRFEANLSHGVWHVGGVLPPGYAGGCLHIEICQRNGRVLRMWGEQ